MDSFFRISFSMKSAVTLRKAVLHPLSIHVYLAPVVETPDARLSASRWGKSMGLRNAYHRKRRRYMPLPGLDHLIIPKP